MPGKIFINYRRGDDPGSTQALFARLEQAFQPDQLFMDVDSIRPGFDFVKVLEEQVAQCDIVLAVIGQNWVNARDGAGNRRLDNPEDFVRIEIESALAQEKRVIPVLVGEAHMPRSDELPEAMKPLARRNAVRLTHERFRADTQGLVKALQEALEQADALRRAQAEAEAQAAAHEERRRAEQAARAGVQAQREAEERAQQQARLTAAQAAQKAQANERSLREDVQPRPTSGRVSRRLLLIGGGLAAGIAAVAAVWIVKAPVHLQAPWGGRLTVDGPTVLTFTGPEGGPFAPDRSSLTLKATGSGFHWSIDGAIPSWFSISPSQGDLATDGAMEVAVAPTAAARSLGHGEYTGRVMFKNQSANETVPRTVNLVVREPPPPPGRLTVDGPTVLTFTGPEGGPFAPDRSSLTLKATGSGFHWSIDGAIPSWFSISPSQGDLATDGAMEVAVAPTAAARSLGHGHYNGQVAFRNHSGDATVVRAVNLVVREPADAPLSAERERALKPKDSFKECTGCPDMVVIPAGSFTMGSPASETGHSADEVPQRTLILAKSFAVGRFAVTFDEWDACVSDAGCNNYRPSDQGWGRGPRPAINVSWNDAKAYVAWLSRKTGRTYRLLSEAEYEYATRAGTTTAYPWGNEIGKGNANCNRCGSQWDGKQTAPVGSFAANAFGLYDMSGNALQWVEDCYHDSYRGAPADASPWSAGECSRRVVRGGSWSDSPHVLRSANRSRFAHDGRDTSLGFRVGRTLIP